MKNLKIISVLLIIILLSSFLVGCQHREEDENSPAPAEQELETLDFKEDIMIGFIVVLKNDEENLTSDDINDDNTLGSYYFIENNCGILRGSKKYFTKYKLIAYEDNGGFSSSLNEDSSISDSPIGILPENYKYKYYLTASISIPINGFAGSFQLLSVYKNSEGLIYTKGGAITESNFSEPGCSFGLTDKQVLNSYCTVNGEKKEICSISFIELMIDYVDILKSVRIIEYNDSNSSVYDKTFYNREEMESDFNSENISTYNFHHVNNYVVIEETYEGVNGEYKKRSIINSDTSSYFTVKFPEESTGLILPLNISFEIDN